MFDKKKIMWANALLYGGKKVVKPIALPSFHRLPVNYALNEAPFYLFAVYYTRWTPAHTSFKWHSSLWAPKNAQRDREKGRKTKT